MKKILLAIGIMMTLMACNKEIITPELPEDGKVVVDFSVVVPDAHIATKSFAEETIETLCAVVFDENGYFVEVQEATKSSTGLGTEESPITFTVSLTQSVSPRNIHFVANLSKDNFNYGMEKDLMTKTVNDDSNVYWQKIKVTKILEGDSELTKLNKIPLVRNFAKIKIAAIAEGVDFELISYKLINVPTTGTIAPYNMSNGQFQSFYDTDGNAYDYQGLTNTGYQGFMPTSYETKSTDPIVIEDLDETSSNDPCGAFYTFESTYGKGLAVIVYGSYDGESASYYKIDLINDGMNYHILRNFEYSITIEAVNGSGYDTEDKAIANPAGNNINYSETTQSYTNISNETSRLFVEYTSKRIVSGEPFTLKYKYISNLQNNTVSTASVAYDCQATFIKDAISNVQGEDGWYVLTLDPKDDINFSTLDGIQESYITLTAGSLSRKVNLYLLKPYVFGTLAAVNENGYVKLTIPLPELPTDIFPLVFDIVDSAQMLSAYTNNGVSMPVKIDNENQTFYYQRTVTRAEYDTSRSIDCYFKTSKTGTTKITISNQYFTSSECSYTKNN